MCERIIQYGCNLLAVGLSNLGTSIPVTNLPTVFIVMVVVMCVVIFVAAYLSEVAIR